MKTQLINAVNFKKLYISDEKHSDYQKESIEDIRTKLTPKDRENLGKRGYDIYVNNNTYFDYEVSVNAAKKGTADTIHIGCYCNNFDVKDVYRAIDDKEAKDKRHKIYGWTAIGAAWLAVLTYLLAGGCSKNAANTQTSALQKAKTEIVQSIKK